MRVAAHDLHELVLAVEGLVVDAAGVHFAEAELAALGDEAAAVSGVAVVELFLVFVSDRRAIDDDAGALERLLRLEVRLHTHLFEFLPPIFVNGELRAFLRERVDLRAVGEERRSFVEGDVVEAPLLAKGGEDADQGLADRPGADYVNDFFLCARHALLRKSLKRPVVYTIQD